MNISGENSSVVCIDEEDESASSSSSDVESEAESLENCTSECDAEAELSQYLASAQGCDDVLKFWVDHKDKYPRLFQLSRQILCAPASVCRSREII